MSLLASCLLHILFRLLEVISVIDELCVRRFHFVLLIIRVDDGVVIVLDSLRKDPAHLAPVTEMLQK